MRKKIVLSLLIFSAVPFLILFLNPQALKTYLDSVYNADLLYPFSVYRGMLNPASHPDWVFGGYTPFWELLVGFVFWFLSRNIQTTYLLFAICQLILLTLSMLFAARRVVGKNAKVVFLILVFSAIPVYLYAAGGFESGWYLFSWYTHVTTAWMGWLALGLLIQFLTAPSATTKSSLIALLLLLALVIIAVMSDALFIAQFTIPAVGAIAALLILRFFPFRRCVYLGLAILYATAGGLALYRLPYLWGSERLAFYGSYFKPTLEQMINNFRLVLEIIPSAWGNATWVSVLWIAFYALCLYQAGSIIRSRKRPLGAARQRMLIFFTFLLAQMAANIGSGLTTITEPGVRYFLPLVFTPLFWGWPFLLAAAPGWMRIFRTRRMVTAGAALSLAALALLLTSGPSFQNLLQSASDAPDFVECLDEKAAALRLHRGMANYWQARPVTLFSKTGLVAVQVDPLLVPFRILNNSDGYADDFDFVIISNDFRPGRWMDRDTVLKEFGPPASSFFCGPSEILVYNRAEDTRVKNHFKEYDPSQ